MKPLHARLQEARKRHGIPWEVLERDYLLSWILAGIGHVESLRDTLVFKGGSALKKCYFGGDYRFSEDLDFSGLEGVPTGAAMEVAVREACDAAVKLLEEYAPVGMVSHRYAEKETHPGGQEAFTIRARLPWQKQPQTRVMILTMDEKVLKPVEKRKVIHEYGEPIEVEMKVYSLEEVVAEKLRAILQHINKLAERGWARSRARDYYDLWRVLGAYKNRMDLTGFGSFLQQKCAVRNVAFEGPEDFFQDHMLAYIEKTWDRWLGPLVPDLPAFQTVIGDLRPQIAALVPAAKKN